ncbi:MAG TPA: peroxiredoxin [Acidimicrobiales bacterium]|nr:peroxiredoxin [Acidimicrobiales bacterium]
MAQAGVGDTAPDFTLLGTGGRSFTLSEQLGAPVVLVFYPGDETPVCTMQLREYSAGAEAFAALGATVWAISPQGVESHERFACRQDLAMPLLADEDKDLGRAFGIVGPLGFYRRSVFVIDRDGVIRYAHRSSTGLTFRPTTDLIEAVRAAETGSAAGSEEDTSEDGGEASEVAQPVEG